MNTRSPMKDKAALKALSRLQDSLRLRGVDFAEWEQDLKIERTGKERNERRISTSSTGVSCRLGTR